MNKIIIIIILLAATTILLMSITAKSRKQKLHNFTPIKNGRPAEAEILNIKQISGGGGGSIKYSIQLTYRNETQEKIKVNTEQYFSALDIIKLEKNKKSLIRYDPESPHKVWIEIDNGL